MALLLWTYVRQYKIVEKDTYFMVAMKQRVRQERDGVPVSLRTHPQ